MSEQRDLDWVASTPQLSESRTERWIGAIVGSVVFGGGAIAAITLIIAAITRASNGEEAALPTRTPTAIPAPVATESASPVDKGPLPADCGGLYSEAMSLTLEQLGFDLGTDFDGEAPTGTADAELRDLIGVPKLDCYWWDGEAGMLTQITEVGEQQQLLAISRLDALGFTEVSEHGGVRYFVEHTTATGSSGESHFFRDDVWFATHWIGHGQYGYTADMVRNVFSD